MAIQDRDRRARIGFGVTNVVVALAILGGVFKLLPTRWWVVDSGALVIGGLLLASGVTLLRSMPLAERLTRWAALVVLLLGMALVTVLFATAGWISGVYGTVGAGGAVIFSLVAALVLPYVVVLPAAELAWLGPPSPAAKATANAPAEATVDPAPAPEDAPPEDEPAPESKKKKKGT